MSDSASAWPPATAHMMDVKLLRIGLSPRFGEQDAEHAQALAYRFDECPPILVDKRTSTVIDGVHRLLAARMIGRTRVEVRYFDGTIEEAFVEAVKTNISHGKPLTLSEREAAAIRILGMRSEWSDRLVASACGLSDKTVGRLRKSTADIPQVAKRIGRDGRYRPTDLKQRPSKIPAARSGQPSTKADDVVRPWSNATPTVMGAGEHLNRGGVFPTAGKDERYGTPTDLYAQRFADSSPVPWNADQAILALPGGREFAEWLEQTRVSQGHWERHIAEIPIGRIPQLIEDARSRSVEWAKLVNCLEEQMRKRNRRV